ncbi:hypothetical protein HY992_03785 [Candidatus Micrarchaeota archaeon]|nr:hypothetical protein [Candidatus Micrarchaeota archaeon]
MVNYCLRCGSIVQSWEEGIYAGYQMCSLCYNIRTSERREFSQICTNCYKRLRENETNRKLGKTLCENCYDDEHKRMMNNQCLSCKKWVYDDKLKRKTPDGRVMCLDCYRKFGGGKLAARVCSNCEKKTEEYYVSDIGKTYCSDCSRKIAESLQKPEPLVIIEEESPIIRKLKGTITKMLGH